MNTGKKFTKIDVLVTAICLIMLAVNLPVISSSGKNHAKTDVCRTNLMQITAAWNLYADENADKIPGTLPTKTICIPGIYPSMDCSVNPPVPSTLLNDNPPIKHHSFPSWVELPHQWDTSTEPSAGAKSDPHRYDLAPDGTKDGYCYDENHYINKERDDQHAIACGTLWKYIKDYKIYRCPAENKGIAVTYVGSGAMNSIQNQGVGVWCNMYALPTSTPNGWKLPSYYIRSQIKKPADSIVFLDYGKWWISWNLDNNQNTMTNGCWFSNPPVTHNNGTIFSFADGHMEYHKWNSSALAVAKNNCASTSCPNTDSGCPTNSCDRDLFYMAKHICGSIGGRQTSDSGTTMEETTITALKSSGCNIE